MQTIAKTFEKFTANNFYYTFAKNKSNENYSY